ncbi:alpha/beta fold hydrolase [Pseudomaricurvus sp. HS19]|uniref:alpha/beta fold hydrolase n=1 Tax=Pseudomaricurvus sp. HS19 TaxID=2692626 RepID=UPI00136A02BC|nr:alpha/beta hydrolase [Pseudomaricurvus sp. HS19]MYM64444.1 alpha/beta fold hydrolase [Pseudomaricurvus sp. HS19]
MNSNSGMHTNSQQPLLPVRHGRRWVLLRGLGRDSRHWGEFIGIMAEAFPHDDFICVDLPGFGRARNFPAPDNIAAIVEFVRKQSEELLVDGPVNLLAISLGGMVAADWMARYPDEISRAVLINTSSTLSPLSQRIAKPALLQLLGSAMLARLLRRPELLEKRVAQWVINREEKRSLIAERWASFYGDSRINLRGLLRQLQAASAFQPAMVTQPVLLLRALGDRLVSPACSTALYVHWRSSNPATEMHAHPGGGHDLPEDAPAWIAQQIRQWLHAGQSFSADNETAASEPYRGP